MSIVSMNGTVGGTTVDCPQQQQQQADLLRDPVYGR